MATVTKRKETGTWRARYIDRDGNRRCKEGFRLKADAEAYLVKVQAEVAAGTHTPDSVSLTVAEAADIWLAAAKANGCDRGTLKSYGEVVRLHIKPFLGTEKLSRLTAPKVVAFSEALITARSRAMASKAVRTLSMIIGEAERRGLISQNVASGVTVKRSKRDKKKVVIPPREHLRALLEAADRMDNTDPRAAPLVRVAMFAGLRQSELRGFIWPDADLRGASLTVTQRADRWNEIGAPKSDAGSRTIPVGPALISSLTRWKLRCPLSPTKLMFPGKPKGAPVKSGRWASDKPKAPLGPMSQGSITDLFLAVQVEAGLAIDAGQDAKGQTIWKPRYGLHCLRHAAASAWIHQGVDLKRLQTWLGHATIQLTLDTYGHLITDAQADAALAGGAEAALLG